MKRSDILAGCMLASLLLRNGITLNSCCALDAALGDAAVSCNLASPHSAIRAAPYRLSINRIEQQVGSARIGTVSQPMQVVKSGVAPALPSVSVARGIASVAQSADFRITFASWDLGPAILLAKAGARHIVPQSSGSVLYEQPSVISTRQRPQPTPNDPRLAVATAFEVPGHRPIGKAWVKFALAAAHG